MSHRAHLPTVGNVTAKTLELVDRETRRIVREVEDTAKQVIGMNAPLLENLANTLIRSETLSGPSLEVFLAGVTMWPNPLVAKKPGEVFIGRDLAHMGNVAAKTLELVDGETRRLVREAEDTAKQVIAMNAPLLENLANTLLRSETLAGPSLEVFLAGVTMWPTPLVEVKNGEATVKLRVGATGDDDDTAEGFGWPERPDESA